MKRRWLLSANLVLLATCGVGCGPLAAALGLQSAFKDNPAPDPVNPGIELRSAEGGTAPDFVASTSVTLSVRANKSGIRLGMLLLGPEDAIDFVPPDPGSCPPADLFTRTGEEIRLTGLVDGASYTLWVRGEDSKGRVACDSHTFLVDTEPPGAPQLIRVEAAEPRVLRLTWSQPVDSGSGISGYNLYYDVGGRSVPDARTRTPGTTYAQSVFVSGADVQTATLSGLFACRAYYVNVTAVDRAGNESAMSAGGEIAKRTRAGGDGTFFAPVAYAPGTWPQSLNAADVDADGVVDLLADGVALKGLVDAGGRPTGTFEPAGWPTGNPIVVDDFNGDRIPDIFLGDYRTYFGDGQGGFTLGAEDIFPGFSPYPRILTLGTGTSRDLVRVSEWGASVSIERGSTRDGRGTGLFGGGPGVGPFTELGGFCVSTELGIVAAADGAVQLQSGTTVFVGADPFDVVAADLDGDGFEDLLTSNRDGSVSVVLGRGAGEFSSPTVLPAGTGGGEIALADFDGNGILDVVVAGSVADSVSVLLGTGTHGRGDGGFRTARTFFAGSGAREVAAIDLNGDGITDLAVAGRDLDVLLGRGATAWPSGGFVLEEQIEVSMRGLALGDVNGDGIADLLGVDLSGDTELDPGLITVMLGKGEEAQGTAAFGSRTKPSTALFVQVHAADFDRDGNTDILASKRDAHAVLLGFGTGAFAAPVSVEPLFVFPGSSAASSAVAEELLGVAVAEFDDLPGPDVVAVSGSHGAMVAVDLNGDFVPDLAATDSASGMVDILYGDGSGGFPGPGISVPSGASMPGALVAVDLNHDRIPDLVVGDQDGFGIHALLGVADADGYATGTFESPVSTLLADRVLDIVACDLDRDGTLELIVVGGGGFGEGPIILLRSNGDGTFTPARNVAPAGFSPVLADLNGDTVPDLVLGGSRVRIYLGTGEVRGD